ncbi:hypothetical protein JTB14_007235 [Gonioctena quinquepunctata]|nr:hypothetical protein JTB14_007235 [Gonioctena quinquepunctata]
MKQAFISAYIVVAAISTLRQTGYGVIDVEDGIIKRVLKTLKINRKKMNSIVEYAFNTSEEYSNKIWKTLRNNVYGGMTSRKGIKEIVLSGSWKEKSVRKGREGPGIF